MLSRELTADTSRSWFKPPTCEDVIAHTIARRISRFLEKAGYLARDAESEYLDLMQEAEDAMGAIVGASISAKR